ncbi:mucin-12-like isoform X2 [Hyla sarda]|uniref:mucin-12-like isoform X2 n=1 Tax=Hyla sarda TaxID=327740 RepID=UPI0024C3963B|nr:mucin-12-like isoform X2 [Hyla sarda]
MLLAELFANDTHEVEIFTTTTLGSQFNMAVTTQATLLQKPSGSHAPTKKTPVHSPAPRHGKKLHPPPKDTSVVTEESQMVQGGGVKNTTNMKHRNSNHNKYISSTHNVTHRHPTKMPVTAKSHSQRESTLRKPIIKKAPTPPSKIKGIMMSTGKNPSARYQSPPHGYHKNSTAKPAMGHFHHLNASGGVTERSKSHQVVTPFRTSLKLGQKDVDRVKQLPLQSHLNKRLKDKANSTSVLVSTVINNSSNSVAHSLHHVTHSFPNSSFMHGKKTMLHELNSLNTSEHVWRGENTSLVSQIDGQKDFSIPELLLNLPGPRQSRVMQELNAKVNIRVPDRNPISNHTNQNSRETVEFDGLGQDESVRLEPSKENRISSTEAGEIGTVVSETKRTNDTQSRPYSQSGVAHVRTTTQSDIQAHNNVEQQYQTRPELTTGGHIHHNQTHGHRHHKHSNNTVSHHMVTSPGRISGANRHHFKHLHNSTHSHDHNEHWVQHQIHSTQVSLDLLSRQAHPSQSPLREETSFHEWQTTVKNGTDLDATSLSHPRNNFSESATTPESPSKPFATVEPKLTTQSLHNITTVSQLAMQTKGVLTTHYEPIITYNKTGPHKLKSFEEKTLPILYTKVTSAPVTQRHVPTQSSPYNTTETFLTELTTQTQPVLTSQTPTHKKTEGTAYSRQKETTFTEIESTTQSKLEKNQSGEPTQNQPYFTHDWHTETQSSKMWIGSSTEPLPNIVRNNLSSSITESLSPQVRVTEPLLTTHSPLDIVTSEDFNETQTPVFENTQDSESRTAPYSRTEQVTQSHFESLSQTDSITFDPNMGQSTTQDEPITKGNSESSTPITSTELIEPTQTEPTTKKVTQPITQKEPTTSGHVYSATQTELTKKASTGWLQGTETVSPMQTETNTTYRSLITTVHKEMRTKSYTERHTQTQHISEGSTESTSITRRGSTTPSETRVKNETETNTSKTEPFHQTTTIGYSRDEMEPTKLTESTTKVLLNPNAPYGHLSPTPKRPLQSTQTDLGTQPYPAHTTRAISELSPTRQPHVQTAKEPLTSGDGQVVSPTTERQWEEWASSGHHNQDGRWDSGPTLSSNVQTFHPITRHTSERDHSSGFTTVKGSTTGTKWGTSPPSNTFTTQSLGEMMSAQPGRDRIFIIDEQQPVFKVQTINVTYKMNSSHHAACEQPDSCRRLLLQELTSAYKSAVGFDKIDILNVTVAGTALEYKVLFGMRPGSLMSAVQELVLSNPSVLFRSSERLFAYRIYNTTLTDNHVDPCTDWFACPRSFQCVPLRKLSALCLSPCHNIFCHNNGICIHRKGQDPECQCPVGRDFWYMGQTCDYRMTHHRLAAIACAVVFCIIICAAAAVFILVRRFQTQILQQKVAQTQSSYRRFSRFDDVPTHFWCPSQTWLTASASLNSLDNPAFSSSEEVFPLQALGSCVCGCQDGARNGSQTNQPQPPARAPPRLETSCSSVNDLMIDSGKASDVSVCSWPMEPIHWTPFPILHQLSLQSPFHARRPHSYFEGMELVNTERSWTA